MSGMLINNYGFFETKGELSTRAGCSMRTKSDTPVKMYIPVEWCEAFNHTLDDLYQWIALVEEALSVKIVLNNRTVQYPAKYRASAVCKGYGHSVNRNDPMRKLIDNKTGSETESLQKKYNFNSDIEQDEWYELTLDGGTKTANYTTFLLLRYFYCHAYIPIVKKALEIYPQLSLSSNKALTAIVMANYFDDYCGYYGLFEPTDRFKHNLAYPVFDKKNDFTNQSIAHQTAINPIGKKLELLNTLLKNQDWVGLENYYSVALEDEEKQKRIVKQRITTALQAARERAKLKKQTQLA